MNKKRKVRLAAPSTPIARVEKALNGLEYMVKGIGSVPVKICMIGREISGRVECLAFDGFGVKYDANTSLTVLDKMEDLKVATILPKGTYTKALKEVTECIKPYYEMRRK